MHDGEITKWIDELRDADQDAAEKLWDHFFGRLHVLGRNALMVRSRRVYDEEDAAQSAFLSFCNGIAAGRFPDLTDRDSLWRLLVVITVRKIHERHQYDRRARRDVRRSITDSVFGPSAGASEDGPRGVELLASREPSPEFAVEFSETCEHLNELLEDETLRTIARLKLEGVTDEEVGAALNCSRRTVQRRLEIIRRRWGHLLPEADDSASDAPESSSSD